MRVCSTLCAKIIQKFHWEGANLTREANQSIRRVGLRAARGGRIKGPRGKIRRLLGAKKMAPIYIVRLDSNSNATPFLFDSTVEADEDDGDEWQEVGPKNKSVVTRRGGTGNSAGASKPPLAEIFQGQMRSCLQPLNGDPTATLQPFFSLQLDIQVQPLTRFFPISFFLNK